MADIRKRATDSDPESRHETCLRVAAKATLDRYYGGASQLDAHRMADALSQAAVEAYVEAFAAGTGGLVAKKILLGDDDIAEMTEWARPDLDDMITDFFRTAAVPAKQREQLRPHLRKMFALMAQQIADLKEKITSPRRSGK